MCSQQMCSQQIGFFFYYFYLTKRFPNKVRKNKLLKIRRLEVKMSLIFRRNIETLDSREFPHDIMPLSNVGAPVFSG